MNWLGWVIIISVVMIIDYHMWLRGGDAIFFRDKTQIEKDLREIQKLEVKQKLNKLKKEDGNN